MTKQKKKLWSMLLAIVMVLTTVFANTNTAVIAQAAEKVTIDAEQVEAGKLVIHFKPTSMKTPYVWVYDDKANYSGGTWPGKAMTDEGNGWYSFTTDETESAQVIFNDKGGAQEPAAQQPGYKMSGEVWYVQGNGGKTTTSNPDGGDQKKTPSPSPTASTKPSEPAKPSPTAEVTKEPDNGIISIKSVTPGDETLALNEKVTLKTEVELNEKIDCAYYKYEVKHNGKYVGDHYYSKKAEYSFTPAEEGEYTVVVSAQAHNMENTTVQKTLTYKVAESVNDATPTPSAAAESSEPAKTDIPAPTPGQSGKPEQTAEVNETQKPSTAPAESSKPGETRTPGQTQAPVSDQTQTPDQTKAPEQTQAPAQTKVPDQTQTPDQTKPPVNVNTSAKPSTTPSAAPSVTPSTAPSTVPASATPAPTAAVDEVKSVSITLSKKTPQYRGRTIKITAKTVGGSDLTYDFKLENVKTGNEKTLKEDSKKNYLNWTPGSKDIGTFKFHVYVKQNGVIVKDKVSGKFTIKNKKLSIDKVSVTKKSKYYTIAASTAGGYGTIQYRYIVKNSKGKVVFRTAYSKTRTAAWKAKKGTYKVYTYVKDSKTKKNTTIKVKIK